MIEAIRREILTQTLEAISEKPVSETLREVLLARTAGADHPAITCVDESLFQSLLGELDGFGPIEKYLADPSVTEILLNSSQDIFIERGGTLEKTLESFATQVTYERFVKRLLFKIDKAADRRHPFAEGSLPDGSRIHVAMPPVTKSPTVSIRRHAYSHWSLSDLKDRGLLNDRTLGYLREQLVLKKNILIVGATGTGKTTLLRAMLEELPKHERIVTVEDTDEIGLASGRGVTLLTRPSPDQVAPSISLRDLIRNALRMRPDRIVVGEIRSDEALIFLEAAATGHKGCLSSIHGGSAMEALNRLEGLVSRAAPQWPIPAIRQLVFNAVGTVVHLERKNGGRSVGEIAQLTGLESFGYLLDRVFPE